MVLVHLRVMAQRTVLSDSEGKDTELVEALADGAHLTHVLLAVLERLDWSTLNGIEYRY